MLIFLSQCLAFASNLGQVSPSSVQQILPQKLVLYVVVVVVFTLKSVLTSTRTLLFLVTLQGKETNLPKIRYRRRKKKEPEKVPTLLARKI